MFAVCCLALAVGCQVRSRVSHWITRPGRRAQPRSSASHLVGRLGATVHRGEIQLARWRAVVEAGGAEGMRGAECDQRIACGLVGPFGAVRGVCYHPAAGFGVVRHAGRGTGGRRHIVEQILQPARVGRPATGPV